MDKKTYDALQIRQANDLKRKKKKLGIIGKIVFFSFAVLFSSFFSFIVVHFNLTNDKYRWLNRGGLTLEEVRLSKMMGSVFLLAIMLSFPLFIKYQEWKFNKLLSSSLNEKTIKKTIV